MRGPGELRALRASPPGGDGASVLEEGGWLERRRVLVARGNEDWYRLAFGEAGLFPGARSIPGAIVLSNRGGRLVVRIPDLEDTAAAPGDRPAGEAAPGFVLKEESYPFPSCLSGILVPPRTDREFRNLATLRSLGFPAVEPVACGRSGAACFHRRAFLVTREFPAARSLKAWSREGGGDLAPLAVERALLAFAVDVARLHANGVYVGTLYGKNVLVRRSPSGGADLAVCDVPRLRRRRGRLRFGLAARDLACLEKWAADVWPARARLAFLRRYRAELGDGPPLRAWTRRIVAERERMLHRTPAGRLSRRLKRTMKRLGLGRWWPF